MKIGLPWLQQLPGGAGGFLSKTFTVLVASLTTSFHAEHNDNDTHKTITATGTISERGRTVPLGEWIDPAITIADFAGTAPLTWAVLASQVQTWEYMLVGKTMFVNFAIAGSTEGGSAGGPLKMKIPGNFTTTTPAHQCFGVFEYKEGATYGIGAIIVQAGQINLYKAARANWLGSGALDVHGQVAFEIL